RRETEGAGRMAEAFGTLEALGGASLLNVVGLPAVARNPSVDKTTAPYASEHRDVDEQTARPTSDPRTSISRRSSETIARTPAFAGHCKSGNVMVCASRRRLFVSSARGNSTATNSGAPSDGPAEAASTYTYPGREDRMRTAPPSTLAVTVCPRSRPSKMSFSILLGVNGLSGARGSGTAIVGGTAGCDAARGAAGVCPREEKTANGLIHCTKNNDPAAVPARSPIAAPRTIDSRRVFLDRG